MTLVLHDWELSADAYRARLLLGFLALPVARVPVDAFPGRETETAAFRALSPGGTLPVLVDGNLVVGEIGAILVHLALTHDAARNGPSGWADAPGAARRALRVLEGRLIRQGLAGEGFLAGPWPTLADVAAFPAAALAVDWGEALERLPRTRLWTRRVRALPGFVTTPGVPEFL